MKDAIEKIISLQNARGTLKKQEIIATNSLPVFFTSRFLNCKD